MWIRESCSYILSIYSDPSRQCSVYKACTYKQQTHKWHHSPHLAPRCHSQRPQGVQKFRQDAKKRTSEEVWPMGTHTSKSCLPKAWPCPQTLSRKGHLWFLQLQALEPAMSPIKDLSRKKKKKDSSWGLEGKESWALAHSHRFSPNIWSRALSRGNKSVVWRLGRGAREDEAMTAARLIGY